MERLCGLSFRRKRFLCAFICLRYLINLSFLADILLGCDSYSFVSAVEHPFTTLRSLHLDAEKKEISIDEAAQSSQTISLVESASKPVERILIYGNIQQTGYYYIYVLVGSPPQRETVILDSGSTLFGFTCEHCEQCGTHVSKRFNISSSTSASWTPCTMDFPVCKRCDQSERCTYSITYEEGSSINGVFFTDAVALGDSRSHSSIYQYPAIGCHLIETKLFVSQVVSGIIGVGLQRFSRNGTAVDAALSQFPEDQRIFSMCLSEEGGELTLGNALNGKKPDNSFQWANLALPNSFSIYTSSFTIADVNLITAPNFNISVIDSGTTYSYLPRRIFHNVTALLEKHRAGDTNQCNCRVLCWKTSSLEELLSVLPPIILHIYSSLNENFDVFWYPKSYLIRKGNGCFELGIEAQNSERILLGMSFLRHQEVIFDKLNKRIGIAARECPIHFNEDHSNFDGKSVAWWEHNVEKHPLSDMTLGFDASPLQYNIIQWISVTVAICFASFTILLIILYYFAARLPKYSLLQHPLELTPLRTGILSPVKMDEFSNDSDGNA
ncbi:aspartyl protease ASP5 [Cardiosporidium cionae]|uniref:Aspartyl protease ASP5 n=1 Tax=Cardiosporidium cionae TaxID=476202 RepID=A0ABQ7JCH3_9APIC|nr:aspartyl protease ASP5 [Cardiosporidium cionae]|eukprot:KAF8821717.1 aspartyl protease ASP5 [Cardiosporidium cionae]